MNLEYTEATVAGEVLFLLPERAIFRPKTGQLLLADLHIGKANHFRKNGMAVPDMAGKNNLWRLSGLIERWAPREVVFLGDLFHSANNEAWPEFVDFINAYTGVKRILVRGNHDVLGTTVFAEAALDVVDQYLTGPFLLTHDRTQSREHFNLYGHVHPAVRMRGKGRQYLRLPCFFFDMEERYGILPSYGDFTGMQVLKPKESHAVFVATETEVMSVGRKI